MQLFAFLGRRFFLFILFLWLFPKESSEFFEINVTVIVGVKLVELASVLLRIHLDAQFAQRIVAATLSQAIFFTALIVLHVSMEHNLKLLF